MNHVHVTLFWCFLSVLVLRKIAQVLFLWIFTTGTRIVLGICRTPEIFPLFYTDLHCVCGCLGHKKDLSQLSIVFLFLPMTGEF